jgi:hypothetical protein
MAFGHPSQHHHERSGIVAALNSEHTPYHLKPHLRKRLKEHDMKMVKGQPITGSTAKGKKPLVAKMPAPAGPDMAASTPMGGVSGNAAPAHPPMQYRPNNAPQIGGRTGVGKTSAKKGKNPLY